MTEFTFKKGDTGLTRGGDKFEVVAEYTAGTLDPKAAVAVIITHATGSQTLHTRQPNGKWHGAGEHHLDLIAPTEKRCVVRADYLNLSSAVAVQFEYTDEGTASKAYETFNRLKTIYKNPTITEVEVPLTRR